MAFKTDDGNGQQSGNYTHNQEAVQRPDIGIQPEPVRRIRASNPPIEAYRSESVSNFPKR